FSHPPTSHLHTLSLHDALPIYRLAPSRGCLVASPDDRESLDGLAQLISGTRLSSNREEIGALALAPARPRERQRRGACWPARVRDRKSTRLNSSHRTISYAVFC